MLAKKFYLNILKLLICLCVLQVARNHGPLTLGRAQEEGSRLLRNNIHSVINELGPLMHHARTAETHGLNLRSWLRRPQQTGMETLIKMIQIYSLFLP